MSRRPKAALRRWAPLALAALAACGLLMACGDSTATKPAASSGRDTPQMGGTLRVNVGGGLTTLDPATGVGNAMAAVGDAVYDSLLVLPKTGDAPQPNIAKSFTASADEMTWTMVLPAGLKFSDGTTFDAAAVKYNLDRDLAPTSSAASLLGSVASVDAPDPTTVIIHMKSPFASLPYDFIYDGSGTPGYIASPAALQTYGKDYTSHAAGLGPFKLASWTPNGNVTLVRNPNYWNPSDPVYLDKVIVSNDTDQQTAFQAVQAGNLDITPTINTAIMSSAKTSRRVALVIGGKNAEEADTLNLATAPFNDVNMRKAFSMALDREQLSQLTANGFAKPATSLFPVGDPYHSSASEPTYDLAGAKALVAAYTAQHGSPPTFVYTDYNGNLATDVIVAQLKSAGFKVTTNIVDVNDEFTFFLAGKYQSITGSMGDFLTPDLLPVRFFSSTGDLNKQAFSSPEFDADVTAARAARTPAEQKADWIKADQVLSTQIPWVWTITEPIGFILSSRVHGIDYSQPTRLRGTVPSFAHEWLSK
jgi:peptide/nickel transport system substrate-binding protein